MIMILSDSFKYFFGKFFFHETIVEKIVALKVKGNWR